MQSTEFEHDAIFRGQRDRYTKAFVEGLHLEELRILRDHYERKDGQRYNDHLSGIRASAIDSLLGEIASLEDQGLSRSDIRTRWLPIVQ